MPTLFSQECNIAEPDAVPSPKVYKETVSECAAFSLGAFFFPPDTLLKRDENAEDEF